MIAPGIASSMKRTVIDVAAIARINPASARPRPGVPAGSERSAFCANTHPVMLSGRQSTGTEMKKTDTSPRTNPGTRPGTSGIGLELNTFAV